MCILNLRRYAHSKARKVTIAASYILYMYIYIYITYNTYIYIYTHTSIYYIMCLCPRYAHSKARKVTIAASFFSVSALSRACVLLHVELASAARTPTPTTNPPGMPPNTPLPPPPPPGAHHSSPPSPPRHHHDHLLAPPVYLALGVALPDLLPTIVALLVLRRRSRLLACFGRGRGSRNGESGMVWAPVDRTPLRRGAMYGEFEAV